MNSNHITPRTAMIVTTSQELVSINEDDADAERAKRVYEILRPIFALHNDAMSDGGRFMAQGANVEIENLGRTMGMAITVTIPVTVGLFGDKALMFLGEIEEALR